MQLVPSGLLLSHKSDSSSIKSSGPILWNRSILGRRLFTVALDSQHSSLPFRLPFPRQLLCLGDLRGSHLFLNYVSVLPRILISQRSRNIEPYMSTGIVLQGSFSFVVHPTQIFLGKGISLFGSKYVPLDGSLVGRRMGSSRFIG